MPLVEEGWFEHPATELIGARSTWRPLRQAGVGALVLGCTHYPLLKPLLHRVMGPGVALIDSAAETARALAEALEREGTRGAGRARPTHRFAVSDDAPASSRWGRRFLGDRLAEAEVVPTLTP